MRRRSALVTVLACALALVATAVAAQELERVLLPISAPDVDGAFGSRWSTEHFIRNDSGTTAVLVREDCAIGPSCQNLILPGTTFRADPSLIRPYLWIDVGADTIDQMYFSTVVRDISGSIEPWGTEIPSVREREFREHRVQLLNVPASLQYRKNLRVYMMPEPQPGEAIEIELAVRIYDLDSELAEDPEAPGRPVRLLGEKSYKVEATKFDAGDHLAVFCLECVFPEIATAERLRVEVQHMAGTPARLWALLTATNNETQHVAILTPE